VSLRFACVEPPFLLVKLQFLIVRQKAGKRTVITQVVVRTGIRRTSKCFWPIIESFIIA